MPRGDGTGPMGMSPMTGCGAGYCNGFAAPGYAHPSQFVRGFGCRFGRGRENMNRFRIIGKPGWARYGYPAFNESGEASFDEQTLLANQAEFLENQLQWVKNRLSSFQKGNE